MSFINYIFFGASDLKKAKRKVMFSYQQSVLFIIIILIVAFFILRECIDLEQYFPLLTKPIFLSFYLDKILFFAFAIIVFFGYSLLINRIEVDENMIKIYKWFRLKRSINKGEVSNIEFLVRTGRFGFRPDGSKNAYNHKFRINLVNGEKIVLKTMAWLYYIIQDDFQKNGYVVK